MFAIGHSSHHEAKYYETDVRGSVRAADSVPCTGAGTARGGNSETCMFDAILFQSRQKRELFHVIAQAPFIQGTRVVVLK